MTGTTLGPYRILEELGRGGMGIVYKAEDTKLERQVALKVLPAAALASQDDRARFYREAKAAAALNHPNIAQIYQIDEAIAVDADGNQVEASDGPRPFIAMEFIEGGTLEDRIKEGPLKLDEAVRIATQTAEALKAAHAKDIVHRDIKSANIMLTTDGQAKVLDFGLAQTSHSTKLTRMGSTLGTVAYMSPEQARGEEVDGRTDLYSLGTVLYEMIAGKLPFGGEYEQAVVYSILNADPEPLTALRTGVPMELERITNKLLSKDADRRYQGTADLIADLSGVDVTADPRTSRISTTSTISVAPSTTRINPWVWKLATAGLTLLLVAAWIMWSDSGADPTPMKFRLHTGSVDVRDEPIISNDGRYIAFNGRDSTQSQSGIFLYDLQTGHLAFPEGAQGYRLAYFSPDSRWLALRIWDGGVALMALPDGPAIRVSDRIIEGWFDNDELFVRQGYGFSTISLDGKPTGRRFMPDSLKSHTRFGGPLPVEPDSRSFLALVSQEDAPSALVQIDAETGTYEVIQEDFSFVAGFASPDLLLYSVGENRDDLTLVVRTFDPARGQLTGPAIPTGFNLPPASSGLSITGHFVSTTPEARGTPTGKFYWINPENGDRRALPGLAVSMQQPKLSPDGTQVVYTVRDEQGVGTVYVQDLESGFQSAVTRGISADQPLWSHDGSKIIYLTRGEWESIPVGAVEPVEQIVVPDGMLSASIDAVSKTGIYTAYSGSFTEDSVSAYRISDIILVGPDGKVDQLEMEKAQFSAGFSPDERFVSFWDEGSENQEWAAKVYDLQTKRVYQVSPPGEVVLFNTGWSPDGKTLYWKTRNQTIRAVDVTREPSVRFSEPRTVANIEGSHAQYGLQVHPVTGELLVGLLEDPEKANGFYNYVDVYLNYGIELRRLVGNTP